MDRKYFSIILIISVIFISLNAVWFSLDVAPPSWDQSWYLETSVRFYNALRYEGLRSFNDSYIHALGGIKAPLISLLPIPFYYIFGPGEHSAMLVNWSLILISNLLIFAFVYELTKDKTISIISVLVTQTFPFVYGLSRQFFVENILLTSVFLYLYCMIRTEYFSSRRWTAFLGLTLGIGIFAKVNFPMYVFIPTLFYLFKGIYEKRIEGKSFAINVIIAIIACVVIPGYWYFNNYKTILEFALSASNGPLSKLFGNPDVLSLPVISYYLKTVVKAISGYYLIILVLTLPFVWQYYRKTNNALLWILPLTFFPTFVILLFSINKDIRYILPILPMMAILIGIGLNDFLSFLPKRKLGYILLIFPLFMFVYYSFYDYSQSIQPIYLYPPDRIDWKTDQVLEKIHVDSEAREERIEYAIVLDEKSEMNHNNYSYIKVRNYPSWKNFYPTGPIYLHYSPSELMARLDEMNPRYLVISDYFRTADEEYIFTSFNTLLVSVKDKFELVGIVPFNNSYHIFVYGRVE